MVSDSIHFCLLLFNKSLYSVLVQRFHSNAHLRGLQPHISAKSPKMYFHVQIMEWVSVYSHPLCIHIMIMK